MKGKMSDDSNDSQSCQEHMQSKLNGICSIMLFSITPIAFWLIPLHIHTFLLTITSLSQKINTNLATKCPLKGGIWSMYPVRYSG